MAAQNLTQLPRRKAFPPISKRLKQENFHNQLKREYTDEKFIELFGTSQLIGEDDSLRHYEVPDEESTFCEEGKTCIDASETALKHMLSYEGDRANFNYDYGDNWNISLVLEEIFEDKALPGKELPRVIAGEGYGIIEDCGGASGLAELAKAFKHKKGEQYEAFREWLGVDTLDLQSFDIADINFRLKKVPRIYTDIYEYHLPPTKQSLDLLQRKYLNG